MRGNPNRLSKPLSHELAGMRTARRGDYRVSFSLDEGALAIHIHRIDHRSDVYRHRRRTAPSDRSRQLRKKEPHD
jgi:mRNA interferase RelE/StbE